jgi:hypothetical protein
MCGELLSRAATLIAADIHRYRTAGTRVAAPSSKNVRLSMAAQMLTHTTLTRWGTTLTHSRERNRLYLIRDLRKEGKDTLVARLVVLRLPDTFCLFQNSGLWCAVPPGFKDFDEDPIGWGQTQREAAQNLLTSHTFRTKAAREGWNTNPSGADFQVLDERAELPYEPDSASEQ